MAVANHPILARRAAVLTTALDLWTALDGSPLECALALDAFDEAVSLYLLAIRKQVSDGIDYRPGGGWRVR
jgi:hypothetical protein